MDAFEVISTHMSFSVAIFAASSYLPSKVPSCLCYLTVDKTGGRREVRTSSASISCISGSAIVLVVSDDTGRCGSGFVINGGLVIDVSSLKRGSNVLFDSFGEILGDFGDPRDSGGSTTGTSSLGPVMEAEALVSSPPGCPHAPVFCQGSSRKIGCLQLEWKLNPKRLVTRNQKDNCSA